MKERKNRMKNIVTVDLTLDEIRILKYGLMLADLDLRLDVFHENRKRVHTHGRNKTPLTYKPLNLKKLEKKLKDTNANQFAYNEEKPWDGVEPDQWFKDVVMARD